MAAAKVAAGFEDMVAAGGVESMSRLGIGASGGATGDPWVAMKSYFISQGLGADIIATQDGITREEVDAYALRSQQRAAHARDNGYFKSLVPVRDMNGVAILDHDEFIRADTSAEGLAKLKPAFQMFNDFGHGGVAKLRYPDLENINCVHTPGNSSGIVDGAGLVLIGNESAGKAQGLKPRARIVSCALVGSEPTIMLDGPVPATQKALKKAGMTLDDICLLYTSPSPRDRQKSRMPSSA